jgi:hypothetical protein
MSRPYVVSALALCYACAASLPAAAHGFGQRYDLPIPLSFYLWSAGAVVAFSFVIFACFLSSERAARPLPHLRCHLGGSWQIAARTLVLMVRLLALIAFLTVVLGGLFGEQNPFRNIAPTMIWIIGWVGIAFLSPVLGNIWQFLNPWDASFRAASWAYRCVRQNLPFDAGFKKPARDPACAYPAWLGVWPAFAFFVTFAWMELVWSGRNVPTDLAGALLGYSALTWAAMFVFGRESWLQKGEFFTLVFGVFARFAPVAFDCARGGAVEIRPPASALLDDRPLHASMVALVIALLATVTFDGFLETPLWARIDLAILDAPDDAFIWTVLNLREEGALRLARTLALPCFLLLFGAAYLLVCAFMSILSGRPTAMLARRFVLSLVPISLAYHIAHYFSYLFIGGQYAIPLVSDPLGRGWDLFGTASYHVDIGLIGPRLQWYVAVLAVVLGHVVAVFLAHVTALRIFGAGRAGLISQIPMLLLMVGYTMCSLWILSQPIIETGAG